MRKNTASHVYKTEIISTKGFYPGCSVPKCINLWGLSQRFAVIQDTYRPDSPDLYFDQFLWKRILEFAIQFGHAPDVRVIVREGGEELAHEEFISKWNNQEEAVREPPEFILVRESGKMVLCIATEYWVHVGGPSPYHDSYTYAFYSQRDISEKVITFLKASEISNKWRLNEPMN